MTSSRPTGVQLHSVTGRKHWFYLNDSDQVAQICDDMEGRVFSRDSLVIDGTDEVTAFPGTALLGITVLIEDLPESLLERERASRSAVTQLSHEIFLYRRLLVSSKAEGFSSTRLCEIEFVSGELLFLQIEEIAVSDDNERFVVHNLFKQPSITCRRLDGGFSLWNTKHIVSWSHSPRMSVPANSWSAERFQVPSRERSVLASTI